MRKTKESLNPTVHQSQYTSEPVLGLIGEHCACPMGDPTSKHAGPTGQLSAWIYGFPLPDQGRGRALREGRLGNTKATMAGGTNLPLDLLSDPESERRSRGETR